MSEHMDFMFLALRRRESVIPISAAGSLPKKTRYCSISLTRMAGGVNEIVQVGHFSPPSSCETSNRRPSIWKTEQRADKIALGPELRVVSIISADVPGAEARRSR